MLNTEKLSRNLNYQIRHVKENEVYVTILMKRHKDMYRKPNNENYAELLCAAREKGFVEQIS